MPPTHDPQASLNTAPRRVLFHVRHFVADKRLALPVTQGLRRRVFATKGGSQASIFLLLYATRLWIRHSFSNAPPPTSQSTTDLKRSFSRPLRTLYLVGKTRRLVVWLFDPQDALSTSRHVLEHAIYFRHQDKLATLSRPRFASVPARQTFDSHTTRLCCFSSSRLLVSISRRPLAPWSKSKVQNSTRVPQATCASLAGGAPAPDLIVVQG
ncbi:hypothetical protein GGF50DRAFT_131853 [Schizophyllum commune]